MKDVIQVKTFLILSRYKTEKTKTKALQRLGRKKNQIETLDPFIGESQY